MTLLSIIIVVVLERLVRVEEQFHYRHYFNWYKEKFSQNFTQSESMSAEVFILIWLAIPCLLVSVLLSLLGDGILSLVLNCFILFVCYGCPQHRRCYRQYLEAACRGDQQACYEYSLQLGQQVTEESKSETLGQTLVWINFRHYFSVIFWFVALGAPGALLYVFARNLAKVSATEENFAWLKEASERLLAILVWLPVRISGFAILFVGHFSKALPVWMSGVAQCKESARGYLARIAKAAEDVYSPEDDHLTEPCVMLKLAKRAFLFQLSVIAVLTLSGVI
ncbi:regulatory protein AmpE [Catenovulum agarivorans DS-2]|uniref:Regulatory protein AmpE n=1 Tax=Catenovulum agarivorans DS-2 TaxID=1328313 RepID=W7QG11_9ALTE|nr:beta-lactamase regulator AmpE [Catenovulum agarivorans]EWH11869.1 regulatory protein AmpE [Catenovulum agarivorans DS-2]